MTESQWKWADLIIKGVGVALITGAITVYSVNLKRAQDELARQDRRLNAAIQFASSQKTLDANLGMQLFQKFVEHYLKNESSSTDQKTEQTILMLRLIALNFQDVPINLKPLFENLDRRILASQPPGKNNAADTIAAEPHPKLLNQLRDVAKEVANRQAFRLTFLDGEMLPEESLGVNEVSFFKTIPYGVRVKDIQPDGVEILIEEFIYNEKGEKIFKGGKRIGPFWVSYYDMPLVDNVKIDKNIRISVSLRAIEGSKARIRLMLFNSDLAADRFDVKELSREFIDDPQGAES